MFEPTNTCSPCGWSFPLQWIHPNYQQNVEWNIQDPLSVRKECTLLIFKPTPPAAKLIHNSWWFFFSLKLKDNCNPIAICLITHIIILGWLVSYLDFWTCVKKEENLIFSVQTKILVTVVGWLVAAQAFSFPFFEPILLELDKGFQTNYTHGVNFAYSGAVILPNSTITPIHLQVELDQFFVYKKALFSSPRK